ncbi:MAG: hypothetical protein HY756_12000 [Nitrospirae bacterium]|nr:hypothetical protein [Nitrospirota bacterium]
MRILLIGNFAPPYEEENLHNLTLLDLLRQEGNDCRVINISESPSADKEFIDIRNYPDFIFKLIRYGLGCDVIHFLTKGYTRPGLMKLITAVFISRLLFAKPFITLHPEMFSVFGRLRSKMGGQQLLHLAFSLAKKVICGDRHTYEIASTHYEMKEKFVIIPSCVEAPQDISEKELLSIKSLSGKKRLIFFSDIKYPSLLFDTLKNFLGSYSALESGVVVSTSKGSMQNIRHELESLRRDITLIDCDERRISSIMYANADFILRPMSCDGRALFEEVGFIVRRVVMKGSYLYFPISLSLIKEGEVSDLCAYLFNDWIERESGIHDLTTEDFYMKIKTVYSE